MRILVYFLVVSIFAVFGCGVAGVKGIRGSGTAKSETRNLSGFTKIKAGGAVKLDVAVQNDFGVIIETDDNLLEHITTEISGDTLIIGTKESISPTSAIKVNISMPELAGMDISGASTAAVAGVKTDSLNIKASGASKIKIGGEAKSIEADASGASGIDAENLKAENADADSNGASSITVNAANGVNLNASGASTVSYIGNPTNIVQNSSGASTIKKK